MVSGGFLSGHPLLLGRHRQGGQLVEVSLIGGLTVKRCMRAPAVEELDIAANRGAGVGHVDVGVDVDLLVFDRPPEPFHHDVVPPGALAVHADLHTRIGQHLRELPAGELAALIGVKDFRTASGSQPEQPHQRIQRHAEISQVLLRPIHRILIGANDPVDQERRPLASRHALFPIAGVEYAGGVSEAPLHLLDDLQRWLAGAGTEDAFVDQQACRGPRAG